MQLGTCQHPGCLANHPVRSVVRCSSIVEALRHGFRGAAGAGCVQGETNRVIGEHQLNRESSRSHSIFTISLEMKMPGEAGDVVVSSVHRGVLGSAACGSTALSSIVAAHRGMPCVANAQVTIMAPEHAQPNMLQPLQDQVKHVIAALQ